MHRTIFDVLCTFKRFHNLNFHQSARWVYLGPGVKVGSLFWSARIDKSPEFLQFTLHVSTLISILLGLSNHGPYLVSVLAVLSVLHRIMCLHVPPLAYVFSFGSLYGFDVQSILEFQAVKHVWSMF